MIDWDEWFVNVSDDQARREWAVAKSVWTDPKMLDGWAHIIEMNRISRAAEQAGPAELAGPDGVDR